MSLLETQIIINQLREGMLNLWHDNQYKATDNYYFYQVRHQRVSQEGRVF